MVSILAGSLIYYASAMYRTDAANVGLTASGGVAKAVDPRGLAATTGGTGGEGVTERQLGEQDRQQKTTVEKEFNKRGIMECGFSDWTFLRNIAVIAVLRFKTDILFRTLLICLFNSKRPKLSTPAASVETSGTLNSLII